MATYLSSYSNEYRLRVVTTIGTQDVEKNFTPVKWEVWLEFGWNSFNGIVEVGYLEIDKVKVWTAPSSYNFTGVYQQSRKLAEGTRNIAHKADGTKEIEIKARFQATSGGNGPGLLSIDKTEGLPTIPRATTPTASNGTLGTALTISTPRASTAFKHTLKYKYGAGTGTIATGVETSFSWTPPVSLASNFTSATSGTCTITCETYNGSTLIGTKTVNITLSIPASVVPSIGTIALSHATTPPTGITSFIQNHSKVKVVVDYAGIHGSTISSVLIGVDSKSYAATLNSPSANKATATTDPIKSVGTFSQGVAVTVTDSRGRKATKYATITIVAWSIPTITIFNARRATDGVSDDVGEQANITMKFDVVSVGGQNTSSWKLQRKSGSDWLDIATGTDMTYDGVYTTASLFSTEISHQIRLLVTDKFATSTSVFTLSTSETIMDIKTDGKGVAFGGVSTTDGFLNYWSRKTTYHPMAVDPDVINEEWALASGSKFPGAGYWYLNTITYSSPEQRKQVAYGYTNNQIYTRYLYGENWSEWSNIHVIYGSNSNGSYVRFSDGTQICWWEATVTDQAINSAYGTLYGGTRQWTFPASFVSKPSVPSPQFKWGSSGSWGAVSSVSNSLATLRGIDIASRETGTACYISAIAIGRWK